MKRSLFVILGSLVFAIGLQLYAVVPVTVMDLQKIKPVDTFYTGEIEAINAGIFSFEMPGKLKSIAKAGDYVFAPIVTEKGKVIRKGTIIAQQHTDRLKYELAAAKVEKKIAEANFLNAQEDYARAKKLMITNVVSKKEFLDQQTTLLKTKLELDETTNNIMKAEYEIEVAQIVAPYSGIVSKTFMQAGTRAGDGDDAIEVTQMTPLLIKIPFPEDIVDSFKEATTVMVYPPGDFPPVYAWSNTSIKNDMVYAYVHNTIIPTTKLTAEQNKLKRVYMIFPVINLSESPKVVGELGKFKSVFGRTLYENPFAVPVKSIRKDDKGTYVLKVSGESYSLRDEFNNLLQFKVEKVYIKVGDIKRDFDLGIGRNVEIQSLKDIGDLKLTDIIIVAGDPDIKDGEIVIKETVRWKFLPGQEVRISIPILCGEGIYVPPNAVIHRSMGDNYAYIVDNGKAKLVHINIVGRSSGYNAIVGDGIKPGAKIIILDRENEFDELYDGVSVEIKKTLPPPERIQYKRVDKLLQTRAEIEKSYY